MNLWPLNSLPSKNSTYILAMLEKFSEVFSGRLYKVVLLSGTLVFTTVVFQSIQFLSYIRFEPLEIEELDGNIADKYKILNDGIKMNNTRLKNIRSGYDYPGLMADIKMMNEEEKRLTILEKEINKDERESTKRKDALELHIGYEKEYKMVAGSFIYIAVILMIWGAWEWYAWDKQGLRLSHQIHRYNLSKASKKPTLVSRK